MKSVYIVSAVRTPIGSFGGVLAGISFFLLNNVFGYLGNINNWLPWFAAAAPGLLYTIASLAAFGWLVIRQ